MRIAILGSGAMGSLFGSYLSQNNHVWLIDNDASKVYKINADGVTISENGSQRNFRPKAVIDSSKLGPMELVIVFVKSMYTIEALNQNRNLINEDTYLMTLQNGAGHESKLLQFADKEHVLIGTTQHNSSVIKPGHINHGGGGLTIIGSLEGGNGKLNEIAENFSSSGFETIVSDNVKKQVWTKLFLNTSASSLTAVLQVPLGFILDNPHARSMMHKLATEAVKVANAECGNEFDAKEVIANIEKVLSNSKDGYTSIYSDVKNGLKTEVDTISGSVIETAKKHNICVPCHEIVVSMIHAFEDKNFSSKTERMLIGGNL